MKPIRESTLDQMEDLAVKGMNRISEFLDDEAASDLKFRKAKLGATTISAFSRTRASESNRMAVELAREKFNEET